VRVQTYAHEPSHYAYDKLEIILPTVIYKLLLCYVNTKEHKLEGNCYIAHGAKRHKHTFKHISQSTPICVMEIARKDYIDCIDGIKISKTTMSQIKD